MSSFFQRLSRELLDLFFPRICLLTGEYLPASSTYRYLSEAALEQVHWIQAPHCIRCSVPFYGSIETHSKTCPNCLELKPSFQRGKALFLLKNTGRLLIHELKYSQGYHLLKDIAFLMKTNPAFIDFVTDAYLVPVPLHPIKFKQRGFNQSLLIAKLLSQLNPTSQVFDVLLKTKFTRSQTRLNRKIRLKNVKNAFALTPKTKIEKNSRYVIVDDVFTTGATLDACAKILKKSGASRIDILTLGHG